jgi:hypothetical protein
MPGHLQWVAMVRAGVMKFIQQVGNAFRHRSAGGRLSSMWRTPWGEMKFKPHQIAFLIRSVASELLVRPELEDTFASKDVECQCHQANYLNGISWSCMKSRMARINASVMGPAALVEAKR